MRQAMHTAAWSNCRCSWNMSHLAVVTTSSPMMFAANAPTAEPTKLQVMLQSGVLHVPEGPYVLAHCQPSNYMRTVHSGSYASFVCILSVAHSPCSRLLQFAQAGAE
jgi:hypothetical protein